MLKSCIQMLVCARGDRRTEKPWRRRSKGATGVWHPPPFLPSILLEKYTNIVEQSMRLGRRKRKCSGCLAAYTADLQSSSETGWLYPWITDWISIKELKIFCWRNEWCMSYNWCTCSVCGHSWDSLQCRQVMKQKYGFPLPPIQHYAAFLFSSPLCLTWDPRKQFLSSF